VALIGVEHWRHRETRRDANGNTTTVVVTSRNELAREPVQVRGAIALGPDEALENTFELPVPPMGPASLDAQDAGLDWTVEAKFDVDDAFDSRIEGPVVVAQPTALLRAGAVRLGEFALYERADVAGDGVAGSIAFDPVPLVCGEGFTGKVELSLPRATKLQEIRAELRVRIRATVSGGEAETITAWSGLLAPEGTYAGSVSFDLAGTLDARALPTCELPHGEAQATFNVILARAWATDTHLARDVAIATTREL
jgi:hypothetical protein